MVEKLQAAEGPGFYLMYVDSQVDGHEELPSIHKTYGRKARTLWRGAPQSPLSTDLIARTVLMQTDGRDYKSRADVEDCWTLLWVQIGGGRNEEGLSQVNINRAGAPTARNRHPQVECTLNDSSRRYGIVLLRNKGCLTWLSGPSAEQIK